MVREEFTVGMAKISIYHCEGIINLRTSLADWQYFFWCFNKFASRILVVAWSSISCGCSRGRYGEQKTVQMILSSLLDNRKLFGDMTTQLNVVHYGRDCQGPGSTYKVIG